MSGIAIGFLESASKVSHVLRNSEYILCVVQTRMSTALKVQLQLRQHTSNVLLLAIVELGKRFSDIYPFVKVRWNRYIVMVALLLDEVSYVERTICVVRLLAAVQ